MFGARSFNWTVNQSNKLPITVYSNLLSLSRIRWQFFCSFTLKLELKNDDWAIKKFFALSREVCRWNHVHFKKLIWCLRSEDGEKTGRRHYHALITGLPEYTIHVGTCMSIKNQWEKLGGGMARVYVFNPSLGGVDYILDAYTEVVESCNKVGVHTLGASVYELSKFLPGKLMLSKSLISVIMSRMNIGDRQCARKQSERRIGGSHSKDLVGQAASDSIRNDEASGVEIDRCIPVETRRSWPCSPVRSGMTS